jgi:large subunit ribosomal protein L29
MTKASNLRDMAVEELKASLTDLSKELYNLVNEMKRAKKLEKPHLIKQKRKEKARLLTILHEKQSLIHKG